jgi:hypothetical protein
MWIFRNLVAIVTAATVAWGTPSRAAQDRGPETFLLMPDRGDTLGISLDQCVERALRSGEEIRTAETVRSTAHARYLQARSTALPQVTLSTTYTRQLESIFQGTGDSGFKFEPDRQAADTVRIRYLEDQLPASGFYAISQLFSNSSFASENTWNAALGLRQKLLQGGSVIASIRAAGHALEASQEALTDKRSEITLQVRPTSTPCWPSGAPGSPPWRWSRPTPSCSEFASGRKRARPPNSICSAPRCSGRTRCPPCGPLFHSGNWRNGSCSGWRTSPRECPCG